MGERKIMKPEDAIELLDKAVAQLSGPRQAHIQFQEAIESLRALVLDKAGVSKGKPKQV